MRRSRGDFEERGNVVIQKDSTIGDGVICIYDLRPFFKIKFISFRICCICNRFARYHCMYYKITINIYL